MGMVSLPSRLTAIEKTNYRFKKLAPCNRGDRCFYWLQLSVVFSENACSPRERASHRSRRGLCNRLLRLAACGAEEPRGVSCRAFACRGPPGANRRA